MPFERMVGVKKATKDTSMDSEIYLVINENLYNEFSRFCERRMATVSSAIRMFVVYYIRKGKADFCYALHDVKESGATVRKTILIDKNLRNEFKETVSYEPGATMNSLIRAYVRYCVKKNDFPKEILSSGSKGRDWKTIKAAMLEIDKIQNGIVNGNYGSLDGEAEAGKLLFGQLDGIKTILSGVIRR